MSAANYTMKICQGSDFLVTLTITDSDGNPVDLTDHTFRGEIRAYVSSPDVVANFSFTKLDQVTDTGKVQIKLSGADSSAITVPDQKSIERSEINYSYDIESETVSGEEKRWLQGIVALSPEVTRE